MSEKFDRLGLPENAKSTDGERIWEREWVGFRSILDDDRLYTTFVQPLLEPITGCEYAIKTSHLTDAPALQPS